MGIYEDIRDLSDKYSSDLARKISMRSEEMELDDTSHLLIYRVLGISTREGLDIDIYQNKGRFLYKYAGSFLEDATRVCFKSEYPNSSSRRIPNTGGSRPKNFEIDCLVDNDAIEIKWRDATTDGDHIIKEHTRLKSIADSGYKPIRIMFYYPNRTQAKKIQSTLKDLYQGLGGEYYFGEEAWLYVERRTNIKLFEILNQIASEKGIL